MDQVKAPSGPEEALPAKQWSPGQ